MNEQPLDAMNDQRLLNQLSVLVAQDRQHTARLLRVIEAIDRRLLWARLGHPSMFDFLVQRCHMSESTAGKRIGAARTGRRFPVIFELVARGELHLSGIHRLKAHLTAENHEQVLARAKHLTIRQIEGLVAELAPKPDAPSSLRALPRPSAAPVVLPLQATGLTPSAGPAARAEPPAAPSQPSCRVPDPAPLSPGRYQLRITLDQTAHDRLAELQDLLAHRIPNGDPALIVARALEALLRDVKKQKVGITDSPRAAATRTPARPARKHESRAIPRALRREVWARDQGRCSFVGEDGRLCGSTRTLEFAHLHPWGKGGLHSADNLALRCRGHNGYEAHPRLRRRLHPRQATPARETPRARGTSSARVECHVSIQKSHHQHPDRHPPHGTHHLAFHRVMWGFAG